MTSRFPGSYLILFLMVLPFATLDKQLLLPQVGYSCCHFYDLDSGTPVFMLGEDLWVRSGQDIAVTLSSPLGFSVSKNLAADSSLRLYQFRQTDTVGTWKLNVQNDITTRSVLLHVLSDQLNVSVKPLSYAMKNGKMLVDGSLTTQPLHQGGVLVLVHKEGNNSLVSPRVVFGEGFLQTEMTWDQANPRAITVTLLPSSLNKSYVGRVWAEISSETGLTKQIGNGEILVSLRQLVSRTYSLPMNISTQRKLSFEVDLPPLHKVGLDGQIPFRPGPIRFTTYVEVGTAIFSASIDTYVRSNGIVSSVTSSLPISPLQPQTDFELEDDLRSLSDYTLILFARQFAVTSFWNMSIVPPITRARLINRLTGSLITDYEIISNQIQSFARIGSDAYILPTVANQEIEFSVLVSGIRLAANEFAPHSAKLEPLAILDISTSVSNVTFRVADAFGSSPLSGSIKITRTLGGNDSFLEKQWTSENGVINLILPLGAYTVDFDVQGSITSHPIVIQHSTEQVDFTLNGLMLRESRNELLLIALVSVIITAEIYLAARTWKRVTKRN